MLCKVGGRSIDQTVAKRDLEAGDIALSIPDDIVVTLDGVFQDESLGNDLMTNSGNSSSLLLSRYPIAFVQSND